MKMYIDVIEGVRFVVLLFNYQVKREKITTNVSNFPTFICIL
jgi:hypothetical protein